MKIIKIALFSTAFFLASCDSYKPSNLLLNSGFEESKNERLATNWRFAQHIGVIAYKTSLDSTIFFNGKQSYKIEQTHDQVYGMASQRVQLPKRENKIFEFSAMLRTEDIADGDGLRLLVNFRDSEKNILKQVQSPPLVGTNDWQKVTLQKPIPEETATIDAGIILQSLGTGWVDEASLIIDPVPTEK